MKFPSLFASLLSLLLLILALNGCAPEQRIERGQYELPADVDVSEAELGQYGGTFIQSETVEPKTFMPLVPNDRVTSLTLGRILSSLVGYDPKSQEFLPALAKSWKVSEDHLTYTFDLRQGVLWSDGQPFTADDVIFTYDCILAEEEDPKTGKMKARYPSRYFEQYHIDGVKLGYRKIDDHTVEFTVPKPYAPFIYDIGQSILPKHKLYDSFKDGSLLSQWSTQTAIESPEEIVGLGPFQLHSFKPGQRLVLKPNPHYWRVDSEGKRLPYLDYFIYRFVGDGNTQTIHFATGQTDAAGISPADYEWVIRGAETYDFKVADTGPSASANFIWFNQNRDKNEKGEPYVPEHKLRWFTDKRFRQAVQYGFNRQGVIDAVYFGRAKILTSLISPAHGKWHNGNVPRYEFNPDKSRELLAEAGFTLNAEGELIDSEGIRVSFTFSAIDGSKTIDSIAVTLMENMKELGIEVKIHKIDFSTLTSKMDQTFDYDAAWIGWGSSSAAYDPNGSKVLYMSNGIFHMWYPRQKQPATEWEARIDELMTQQEGELNRERRYEIMHEVQMILAEELPLLYVTTPEGYVGYKKKWRNIWVPPAGTLLWNIDEIWLDPDHQ